MRWARWTWSRLPRFGAAAHRAVAGRSPTRLSRHRCELAQDHAAACARRAELTLDDASLGVVERLVASDNLRDVRLALDMLQRAEHPALADELLRLSRSDPRYPGRGTDGSTAIGLLPALPIVQALAATGSDVSVQAAAIRARCALERVRRRRKRGPETDNDREEIRLAAAVGCYVTAAYRASQRRRASLGTVGRTGTAPLSGA